MTRLPSLAAEQRALLKTHLLRGVHDHRSRDQVVALVEKCGQKGQACQWLMDESDQPPKFCR
ncbi:hypothetical protein [Microbulbifer pacificus]|uniref:Transposase n=1 Tax=Microbulbifer pacificus TaxID=407164 RepID=A0AAU0MW04_9GAMM|nr:hypothetical protein [Microbulbifer pacificus]WOX04852.1 hypothetical protein R5R33_14040 [Microbulbifer pacificus]